MSQCRRLSNLSQQLLELSALREEGGSLGKIQVDKLFYAVKQTILDVYKRQVWRPLTKAWKLWKAACTKRLPR